MYDSNFCHEIYIINYSNKIIKRIHDLIISNDYDQLLWEQRKTHPLHWIQSATKMSMSINIYIYTHKKTTTDFSNEQIERTVISGYKRNAGRIKRIFISRCHGRRFRRRYFIVISLLYPAHG